MKLLIISQRLMASIALVVGFFLMLSETPLEKGLLAQAWLTFGGMFVILLSLAWLWLIDKEESYFIHEAR